MRLEKEIKEFGYFTLGEPCDHIDKIPGFLSVDRQGNVSIELYDLPCLIGDDSFSLVNEVHGTLLLTGDEIIALDCFCTNIRGLEIASCKFQVNLLLLGEKLLSSTLTYSNAIIALDGLLEWHGYNEEIHTLCNSKKRIKIKPLDLYDGEDLSLQFLIKSKETHTQFTSVIKEIYAKLKLNFKRELDLRDVISNITKINSYFLFSLDTEINMELPVLLLPNKKSNSNEIVKLYYRDRSFPNSDTPKYINANFLHYKDIPEGCVKAWFDAYSKMPVSIWHYLSYWTQLNFKKTLDIEPLIQAIEALHRTYVNNIASFEPGELKSIVKELKEHIYSLYETSKANLICKKLEIKNTPSLNERILELLDRNCPTSVEPSQKKRIAKYVKDLRNTISHASGSEEEIEPYLLEASFQINIAYLLEVIYKMEMLRIFGIKEERTHEIIARKNDNLKILSLEDFNKN
ncbi:MAG: hypothetical protein CVV54_07030 [Synergistetes bacterium HGW-Synergistetes-1]|nr:MAG: hypothetical protein CVV54_07030 [Synergistetes bacterium HGW-Synergistetes-1]